MKSTRPPRDGKGRGGREKAREATPVAAGAAAPVVKIEEVARIAGVHRVNDAIRAEMKAAGRSTDGQPLNWDEAQKRDARFYEAGHHAVFLKRYGRFDRGDVCEIATANEHGLVLVKNGRRSTMSYRYANRITVASASRPEIAAGDRLQLKLNGRSVEGLAFNNGYLVTVRDLRSDGPLRVGDAAGGVKTLAPAQHVFTRGHVLCIPRRNRGYGASLQFGLSRRDQPQRVVCRHLSRSAESVCLH